MSEMSASLRAGDRDRDAVTGRLATALSLGYLSQDEFDQRSTAALRATTVGELAALEVDLPRQQLQQADPEQQRRRQLSARRGLTAHVGGYAASVVIMLAIWVITAIAYGPYYFWPIWPILGGAMGVVGHALPHKHGKLGGFGACRRAAITRP